MTHKNPWPSGESKPLILLSDAPSDLSNKHNLIFIKDADDLDVCYYCYKSNKDVGVVLFHYYENSPSKGTVIYVDKDADTIFAINKLIENYALYKSRVKWVQSDI